MGRPAINIEGKTFGRLTVVGRDDAPVAIRRDARWVCRCECGNMITTNSSTLRRGTSTSCGCFRREKLLQIHQTHGMTGTTEFRIWSGMLRRCLNAKVPEYNRYGGRGISMCVRWLVFENFFEDMGQRPPGKTLDRKDNDGNYEPSNCRWATPREQASNRCNARLIRVNGETKTVLEWAAVLAISPKTIHTRLHRGWSNERALQPSTRTNRREGGFFSTSAEGRA
jgi:hypothetical protein